MLYKIQTICLFRIYHNMFVSRRKYIRWREEIEGDDLFFSREKSLCLLSNVNITDLFVLQKNLTEPQWASQKSNIV